MKKLVLTAALAAMCAGFNAYAQQPAGAPDGGISAEMLAKISDRYEDVMSDWVNEFKRIFLEENL